MSVVEKGSSGAQIIEEEERLLERVLERIAEGEQGDDMAATAADLDRELIALRDLAAEARAEDLPPIIEQMTRLSAIRAKIGGNKAMPVDPRSPYFAHMVLSEGGKSRDVLIGKRGFIDRSVGVQIVDWRNAPISQVYYRYDEGDDFDEEIGGRRFEGIVRARRNLSIHASALRRIGTSMGTFVRSSDGKWHQAIGELKPTLQGGVGKAARAPKPVKKDKKRQRKLGVHHDIHRADKHLPEIAALIDPEQFDLISQPASGMVVIQGGAGSGKTTVALHRVAFLCFADRQRFKPHRMLVVVPTSSLARYVEGVLPSLGVRGVSVTTYAQWARKQRLKLLPESSKKTTESPPEAVVSLKKHPAVLRVLEGYVAERTEQIAARIAELDEDGSLQRKWRDLSEHAVVPRLLQLRRWYAERGGGGSRARVEQELRRLRRQADHIVGAWAEIFTDFDRLRSGMPDTIRDGDIERCVSWCTSIHGEGEGWTDDDGNPIVTADGHQLDEDEVSGRFDAEDDPILLRLIQLVRGGLLGPKIKETWYEHVAIDEAQDRSAIEVKVLLEATSSADDSHLSRSVTIAGDVAQRLIFDNHFRDWHDLLAVLGFAEDEINDLIKPLSLSYRSTAEVMQLAREILGPELAPKDDLMARSGAPVELHGFGDTGEAVAFLGDALRMLMSREPTASVAVIARYPEQADVYYAGFVRSEVPALRRVRNHEFEFAAGIDVTDVAQVKGLEFDYVVMVDVDQASYPDHVEARHLMHIGVTRAAHQLWLIAAGPPSKILPERLREGGLFALT